MKARISRGAWFSRGRVAPVVLVRLFVQVRVEVNQKAELQRRF